MAATRLYCYTKIVSKMSTGYLVYSVYLLSRLASLVCILFLVVVFVTEKRRCRSWSAVDNPRADDVGVRSSFATPTSSCIAVTGTQCFSP